MNRSISKVIPIYENPQKEIFDVIKRAAKLQKKRTRKGESKAEMPGDKEEKFNQKSLETFKKLYLT